MNGEPDAREAREVRGFRLDLLIAICALLMSTLATGASWWQSRVVATQLSSQVWPYLSITTTAGPGLVLDISNDGLGPAVVRSLQLTVDDKPYPTLVSAMNALLGPHAPQPHGRFASIGVGSVIRAGGDIVLIKIENPKLVTAILAQSRRFDLHVCYCSILGDCWVRTIQGTHDPARVNACPVDGAAHYEGAGLPP